MKLSDPLVSLAPSHAHSSRRQYLLSQDARDLLAWAFREGLPASDFNPLPMNAAEVKVGAGDCDCIAYGNNGFYRHSGSDSIRYMHHAEDEEWALVFAHDCDGDADRGEIIASLYAGGQR